MGKVTATWKATERRVARRLGGQRTGNRGIAAPDVTTTWASVEVKHRATLPAWLLAAMRQAEGAAIFGQLPVVVLHQLGERSDKDLVVLRLGDFLEWFGEPEKPDHDVTNYVDDDGVVRWDNDEGA